MLFRVVSYIQYYLKRKDEYSLHSPFLFDFYCKTVKARNSFQIEKIEQQRACLLDDHTQINLIELGALNPENKITTISRKAKSSLSSTEQSCFLGALTDFTKAERVLEIGTSFGISTSYLASNNYVKNLITLEGEPTIRKIAVDFFQEEGLRNVNVIGGNFDETIPRALDAFEEVDLVFFDGNHKYAPTLQYFNLCMVKAHNNSVFVFHDIYWSAEMKKAWLEIIANPKITLSIDLFYFGIVFFRLNQPKQHFNLKF